MGLDLLQKAARAQLREERRAARKRRRRDVWARWVGFWDRLGKQLKIVATVVGAATAIVSGGMAAYHGSIALWRGAVKAWALYRARDVGEVLPKPNGISTTALDFVSKDPPDGGRTK